jgi:hypothetical protein
VTARCSISLAFLMFSVASSTSAQTARDYFNELKVANEFNRYKDEYVCFRDDDVPSFDVVARGSTIIEHMKKAGQTPGKETLAFKDGLFVQTYTKGVAISGGEVYEGIGKSGTDFEVVFMKPLHGKIVYSFNWLTGRYRWVLYDLDRNKILPAQNRSGKCELIHPGT